METSLFFDIFLTYLKSIIICEKGDKMKKRNIFLLASLFIGGLSLASCSNSKIVNNDDNSNNYITNGANVINSNNDTFETNNLKYTPVYEALDASYNETDLTSKEDNIEDTVSNIYDSVVSISATSTSSISSGSAVFFAKDNKLGFSYLLTCFHVIDGAYDFSIKESDGDTYEAYLVAGYEDEDLAIMAIKPESDDEITYASLFSDSDTLKLGSTVICIGNPLGILPGSVSKGVISYNNRVVSVDTYKKQTLIQTDVAINSGNSGGGLFNNAGALIGIVSAKYSSSGIEGLGFAIPSNTIKDVITELFRTAKYDTANQVWEEGYYEGDYEFAFEISLGTYERGYGFNQTRETVAYISSVNSNETYTGNELKTNDIIRAINIDYKDDSILDTSLDSFNSITEIMNYLYNANLNIGDTITFSVTRSNQKVDVTFNVIQYKYSI